MNLQVISSPGGEILRVSGPLSGPLPGATHDLTAARIRLNQRRAGVTMRYFDPCTRAIFAASLLALAGLIAIACWLEFDRGLRGAFLVAGVLAVPLTVAFGRWTDKVLRSPLQAGG